MNRIAFFFALFAVCGAPLAASAAVPQPIGKFGFWNAFQVVENSQPVCYMSLTGPGAPPPAAKGQKPAKRGNVVLMITHRPAEGSRDVVSYAAGLKFKNGSEAKVDLGGKSFQLFTQNDTAWSRDAATDHALTLAIRTAPFLVLAGEGAKEEPLSDKVKLTGADEAYLAISKACGVKAEAIAKPAPAKAAAKPSVKKK